jgi:hypothetical protein
LNAVLNAANFSPKSVQTCFEARNWNIVFVRIR